MDPVPDEGTTNNVSVAAAVPRRPWVAYKKFFLIGIAAAALIGGIFFLRRSREAPVSLITHSMDRDKE
jgi:hypothetical protein